MPKRCVSLLVLLLLAGCTRAPLRISPTAEPTTAPPAFVSAPAEVAIPQLIAAEREASRSGDLALLAQLWAPDARIVDTRTDGPTLNEALAGTGQLEFLFCVLLAAGLMLS